MCTDAEEPILQGGRPDVDDAGHLGVGARKTFHPGQAKYDRPEVTQRTKINHRGSKTHVAVNPGVISEHCLPLTYSGLNAEGGEGCVFP